MALFLMRSCQNMIPRSRRTLHHLLEYRSQSTSVQLPAIGTGFHGVFPITKPLARIPSLSCCFSSQMDFLDGHPIAEVDESESKWEHHVVAINHSIQRIKSRIRWQNLVSWEENWSKHDPQLFRAPDFRERIKRYYLTCTKKIRSVQGYEQQLFNYIMDAESALQEMDSNLAAHKIMEIEKSLLRMRRDMKDKELKALLSTVHGSCSCFIEVEAGPGGIESMEWAAMVINMYKGWADFHGFGATMVDEMPGQIAGIEHATIKVDGEYAFGYAQAEAGVHRLEWIPPSDSEKCLRTSFAAVTVIPTLDDISCPYEINESELKFERFSVAGGHRTTESAVRIVHIPTNVTVTYQDRRLQPQTKELAMELLQARLNVHLEFNHQHTLRPTKINWANKIRTYVLHPHRRVKDHRTGYEHPNPDHILKGNLDDAILSFLSDRLDNDKSHSFWFDLL